jgi:SAM-dependent methyltransferase
MPTYQRQQRGNRSDYERYLQSMDASMQQKVALTAAHMLGRGWLADMGMGSGTGSEALAALYPELRVTGVDINPEMVELAQEKYELPNLDFRVGDIGQICFEEESLDVVFDSSVLHHVTTFNGYDKSKATEAIENQVKQLKVDGNLIIRDFLRPEPGLIWLELPAETVPLFQRFAQEFRYLKDESERGFEFRELDSAEPGWQRFELQRSHAVEFVLRKDYTADWETEVLEEYTYFTQAEFESTLRGQRLRILASTPLRNPWIIRNRFDGQFRFLTVQGDPLENPPTNYLIVGEKVQPTEDVSFDVGDKREPIDYLEMSHYRHKTKGSLRDLIRRPNATLDVIPYFRQRGEVYVLARKSYPRPLLALCTARLDGGLSPTYVTEPIVVIQQDKPIAQTVEEALEERAGLKTCDLKQFHFGSTTYPSPGGLQEEVRPVFVEVEPRITSAGSEKVRAVAARQLLRAAQVGGLPDARLELHICELLDQLGESPGSWIGEQLSLAEQPPAPHCHATLPESPSRRAYEKTLAGADFLQLGCRKFQALTHSSEVVDEVVLEYCQPKKFSLHTAAVILLRRSQNETHVGLVDDDFPAAQCFRGHSNLWVTPAWRLPLEVTNLDQMEEFTRQRLADEMQVEAGEFFTLGGPYYPSPGSTPEVVYPLACEARGEHPSGLVWVSMTHLVENFARLRDGHLKTLLSRASRALKLVQATDSKHEQSL